MSSTPRLLLVPLLAVLVAASCTSVKPFAVQEPASDFNATPTTPAATPTPVAVKPQPTVPTSPPPKPVSPKLIQLSVPFASQAPLSVWDDLHNEACEEASLIMANAYVNGGTLPPQVMEDKILDLVAWEEANGYSVDTTADQTAAIARDRFGLTARVSADVTVAAIRAELERGNLVIVPAAGRRLGNPNFKRPGPLYHMLVIRGHNPARDEFITNDPGTRKGENYRYRTRVLLDAVHDWPKPGKTKDDVTDTEMEAGARVMIIVEAKN